MSEKISHEHSKAVPEKPKPEALDAEETRNPVLTRLIEEVRNESTKDRRTYNRVHNRHNR